MTADTGHTKEARFRAVMEQNQDRMFRICLAYLPDRDEAHDLYQEMLIRIWQNLDTFRGEAQLSTWVYRVAVNTALMHQRKEKRRRKLFSRQEAGEHAQAQALDTPEDPWVLDRQLARLRSCINQLPEQDRILASMLLDGLAYKEMATVMGMSVNLVGVRISRIKKKLAKAMKTEAHGF